jgi:NAD-specific glutamate dehydrogenase
MAAIFANYNVAPILLALPAAVIFAGVLAVVVAKICFRYSLRGIYFAVGTRFSLKWLRSKVSRMSYDNQWQRLSSKTILEDLYSYQMRIAKAIVDFSCNDSSA